MELRHLRYFLAVAEERHFTRAAKRLGVGQPPLSQQIKLLEQELGVRLFDRSTRGAELTDAGRAFHPFARSSIEAASAGAAAARRAARGEVGSIAVGFTGSASFNPVVTRTIRMFRGRHPAVATRLVEAPTAVLTGALGHERVDIAFCRPAGNYPAGLATRALPPERLLAALPDGHRLAGRPRIRLTDLRQDDFVLFPRVNGPRLYDAMMMACTSLGFSPTIAQEAPELTSTINLVAAGTGVALVPESMRQLRANGVAYAEIEEPTPAAEMVAAWRDAKPVSPMVANFLACLSDALTAIG